MSEKDYQFSYKTYLLSEANEKDKALIESAFQCRTNAYVPYSRYITRQWRDCFGE